MGALLGIAVALAIFSAVFTALERRFAAEPYARWWRRSGHATDLAYWFFTPIAEAVTRFAVIAAVVLIAIALGAPLARLGEWIAHRRTLLSAQPKPLQAIEALVLSDFIGYWAHRWLHGKTLWRFHAIHHSTRVLDWFSSVRNHPLNEVIGRVIQFVPLFVLGLDARILAAIGPFFVFYGIALHANVRWSFGRWRHVFASPVFHRWHHTSEERGLDKNFSGLFPIWDLLFGTFYMPDDELPSQFGTNDKVPEGFFAQMVYPFKRR